MRNIRLLPDWCVSGI